MSEKGTDPYEAIANAKFSRALKEVQEYLGISTPEMITALTLESVGFLLRKRDLNKLLTQERI
jgi:hypothetical protein